MPIIDGGGRITVGIFRPTVIISQKNKSQKPKSTGIPKEYISGNSLLSSFINFSTANQEKSQAQIDKSHRVGPKVSESSLIINNAATKLTIRSNLKSSNNFIFLEIRELSLDRAIIANNNAKNTTYGLLVLKNIEKKQMKLTKARLYFRITCIFIAFECPLF